MGTLFYPRPSFDQCWAKLKWAKFKIRLRFCLSLTDSRQSYFSQFWFIKKSRQVNSKLSVCLRSTNQIRDFSTSLGLVFSQICLVKFTIKQTKVKKSWEISAKMRKISRLLWVKSDKNVKQTKVEKSRSVSNCIGKGSFTSWKFRDGKFLNEPRFFPNWVLPSVNELRKNLSWDQGCLEFHPTLLDSMLWCYFSLLLTWLNLYTGSKLNPLL